MLLQAQLELTAPEDALRMSTWKAGGPGLTAPDNVPDLTPMDNRTGAGVAIYFATMATPLGVALLGATELGLCFLQFGDAETLQTDLRHEYPAAELVPMPEPTPAPFAAWMEAVRTYLDGRSTGLWVPVHVCATPFQQSVWRYLRRMPAGFPQSYTDVALALGRPTAARAVARACALNVVALAIPCHRVVRGTGALSGYRWGLHRKRKLLEMESWRSAGVAIAPRTESLK